jgi:uncharacterized repeat protein (TIGR03803 family)
MPSKSLILSALTLLVISGFAATTATAFAASKEKILYSFCSHANCADGAFPETSLIFDAAGNLYGTTNAGGDGPEGGNGVAFRLTPDKDGGWTETVLHTFCPWCTNGVAPSSLSFDSAGNLYGVFSNGGPGDCGRYGLPCGQVFELMPSASGPWSEKILFGFVNKRGWEPFGGLILDSAGNLYGATAFGGDGRCDELDDGCGTVFEASPLENGRWAVKFLHAFDVLDGAIPEGSLIFDAAGNLYGSSAWGGPPNCDPPYLGCGSVFKLTHGAHGGWTETTLHNFAVANPKDGIRPNGSLVMDASGNLYGTTLYGGTGNTCNPYEPGCGTVFELIPQADGKWAEKVLHNFKNNGKDGYFPNGGLVLDKAGNLYGTSLSGGAYSNSACLNQGGCGAVFELSPGANGKWTEKTLHSFNPSGKDGYQPPAGLVIDQSGNLYGTTLRGGTNSSGTVFEITP